MKDMIKNLFNKPNVLFMLMVICLSPLAVFHTISACVPDPCPALLAAWRAAYNASVPYFNALITATEAYDAAYLAYLEAELNRVDAIIAFQAAGTALAIAIAAGAPAWVILSLTIALYVAEKNYQSKKTIRDVKLALLKQAEENLQAAGDAYLPYHNAVIAAMNAYYAAGCGD